MVSSAYSAPENFVYCPRCATLLDTKLIQGKWRRVCTACNYIHFVDPKVGVGVVVLQNGKLLLVRRTMNPERGKWSIPAGYVDYGDDPRQTAVREAFEETNLQVTIEKLVNIYYNPPSEGGATIFIVYQAQVLGGHLQAGDDADAADFFALDELPVLAFASTHAIIQQLRSQ